MLKLTKYHWLLLASSILIPILLNVNIFAVLLREQDYGPYAPNKWGQFLYFGRDILIKVILFNCIAFFNYTWKDKLVPLHLNKNLRIALIVLGNIIIYWIVVRYMTEFMYERWTGREFKGQLFYSIISQVSLLIISASVPYLILQFQTIRLAELNNSQLREAKAKAELVTLKEQISPHFFFNTLSSLSAIIRNAPRDASLEFVKEMSNTYRYTLSIRNKDLVPLKEELDFIHSYNYLLKKRFGNKIEFEVDLSSQDLNAEIPPMALQLLIENGIQHNIITKSKPLHFRIYSEENWLCIENNLMKRNASEGFGMGLQNLGTRYNLLLKKDIRIVKNMESFIVKLPLT